MSQWDIEIHFEQMKELAESLSLTASRLQQTVNETGMEIVSGTKEAWISKNADVFAEKEVKLFEKIGKVSIKLSSLSTELSEKAKQVYALEQKNTLLAKVRSYIS